jgi:hypothetical protein
VLCWPPPFFFLEIDLKPLGETSRRGFFAQKDGLKFSYISTPFGALEPAKLRALRPLNLRHVARGLEPATPASRFQSDRLTGYDALSEAKGARICKVLDRAGHRPT